MMPVDTLNREHHWPGICKKNAPSWRNGPTGASWRSATAKAKFCHWDGLTPCHRTGCSPAGQTAALWKMTRGPCGQKVDYESAVCPCSHRGKSILGYMSTSAASSLRVVILPFCSALGRHLKTCTQFGASQYKKDIDVLEQVQQKPRRWLGAGDHEVQKGAEKDELAQDSGVKSNRRSYCCF